MLSASNYSQIYLLISLYGVILGPSYSEQPFYLGKVDVEQPMQIYVEAGLSKSNVQCCWSDITWLLLDQLLDSCTILFHSLTHTEEEIHDIGLLRGICLIFLTILLF